MPSYVSVTKITLTYVQISFYCGELIMELPDIYVSALFRRWLSTKKLTDDKCVLEGDLFDMFTHTINVQQHVKLKGLFLERDASVKTNIFVTG